jgi:hypothetical protein
MKIVGIQKEEITVKNNITLTGTGGMQTHNSI